jgi:hypothetical protein
MREVSLRSMISSNFDSFDSCPGGSLYIKKAENLSLNVHSSNRKKLDKQCNFLTKNI